MTYIHRANLYYFAMPCILHHALKDKDPSDCEFIQAFHVFHMVTISNRDKEMIIWNFMEELCDKYLEASENNLPADFNIKDFRNMNIFSKYLLRRGVSGVNGSSGDALVLVTLKKYAESKGLITVEGDSIALTEKGIAERHKIHRDWDGI